MTRPTGYLQHPLFSWPHTGTTGVLPPEGPLTGGHPLLHFDNPNTTRDIHELVRVSGLLDHLHPMAPRPATRAELLRVHTPEHVARIEAQSDLIEGGDAGDGFTPVGYGSYEIALLAAGGMIELAAAVARGEIRNGHALIRPPGHHATADTGMGLCLFNNLAVTIAHLQAELGVGRIAVVDWDAHHGNGTQSIFYTDPTVLTISLHQAGYFPPDSGWITENGEGAGLGHAINIPLPPGTGANGYLYAMDKVVVPALHRFQPHMILIACGFDTSMFDPLGRQMLTATSYAQLTTHVMDAADQLCEGRIAVCHEGAPPANPAAAPKHRRPRPHHTHDQGRARSHARRLPPLLPTGAPPAAATTTRRRVQRRNRQPTRGLPPQPDQETPSAAHLRTRGAGDPAVSPLERRGRRAIARSHGTEHERTEPAPEAGCR